MQQLSELGQHEAPKNLILVFPVFHWKQRTNSSLRFKKAEIVENDEGNLRVDMDRVPLEGNKVFSCVQQDRLGGMLGLIIYYISRFWR